MNTVIHAISVGWNHIHQFWFLSLSEWEWSQSQALSFSSSLAFLSLLLRCLTLLIAKVSTSNLGLLFWFAWIFMHVLHCKTPLENFTFSKIFLTLVFYSKTNCYTKTLIFCQENWAVWDKELSKSKSFLLHRSCFLRFCHNKSNTHVWQALEKFVRDHIGHNLDF